MIPIESTKERAIKKGKQLLKEWIKNIGSRKILSKDYDTTTGSLNPTCACGFNKAVQVYIEMPKEVVLAQTVRYCGKCCY